MTLVAAGCVALAVVLAMRGSWHRWPRYWWVACVPVLLLVPRPLVGAAVVCVIAAGAATRIAMRRRAQVRRAVTAVVVRECCEQLAAELAAGQPTAVALRRVAARWAPLRRIVEADRYGSDVPAAWSALATDVGIPGLALVGVAWRVAQDTGLGLSVAVRHVAASLRTSAALDRTIAAELASARATARLVVGLPVAVLVMGSGLGGNPWHFLFVTTPGVICLTLGAALGLAGLWWIDVIAEGATG